MILILIQSLFSLVVIYFAVHVALEFRMVRVAQRCERTCVTELHPGQPAMINREDLPPVTVFLPVYNESAVIERLIDAVCRLDYPREKLEILVLDDSTDETTALALARVEAQAQQGVNIRLLKRMNRNGYKAGNLAHGLRHASGEFLAIFDADFCPPADFLLRTIPCFKDDAVGYLQTGIGYSNRDASFLTRFQAMLMGHQQFVTVGLSQRGMMASLSGSSCVWRRACVENLGGWSAETITEDVDLGYQAQFNRWKFAYLRDVVSLSELPETISAIRVQRDRWARGLIHNAFKHMPRLFSLHLSMVQRLHCVSLLFSSLLLAAFFVLTLFTLPLALMSDHLGLYYHLACASFLLIVLVWAASNFIGSHTGARYGQTSCSLASLTTMVAYVAMFLPLSLYYFSALVQILANKQSAFNRTPKGLNPDSQRQLPINRRLHILEAGVFCYSGLALVAAVINVNPWVVPFSLMACLGYGLVLYFSWAEGRRKASV